MPNTSLTQNNNFINRENDRIQTAPTKTNKSIADFQLVYISTSGILKPESQMPKKRPRVEKILLK